MTHSVRRFSSIYQIELRTMSHGCAYAIATRCVDCKPVCRFCDDQAPDFPSTHNSFASLISNKDIKHLMIAVDDVLSAVGRQIAKIPALLRFSSFSLRGKFR